MKNLVVILALALAALGSAPQASAAPKPDAMVIQLLRADFRGDWGKAWDLLHPGQQRLVPREKFSACQTASATFAGYVPLSMRNVGSSSQSLHATGVAQRTSTAVTFLVIVKIAGFGAVTGFQQTTTAVWTGTRWAWALDSGAVAAYRAGRCPS